MNERNVEALTSLIVECFKDSYDLHDVPMPRQIGEFLASRGVLVPSALTPEQLGHVYDIMEHLITPGDDEKAWKTWDAEEETRAYLERVAKGEKRQVPNKPDKVEP